jgi:hypothetical protein
MAPLVGYELHRRGRLVPRVLLAGLTQKEVWTRRRCSPLPPTWPNPRELVLDCGHFIADEKPELVAEPARALFAPPA